MTTDMKSSAGLVGKILASGQIAAANTDTTVYTVDVATASKLVTFSLTNVSGGAVVVSVSVVPHGQTLDGTRKVVAGYSLAAGDSTKIIEIESAVLDAGASISANANTATAINYLITGEVYS